VHRVIKAILRKSKYQLPVLPTPGEAHAKLARRLEKGLASKVKDPAEKLRKPSAEATAWQAAGLHCSANERRADEASRDVEAWLKCKYMREHLGEEYGGVVSSATSFGLFVTLDAMYVEGLVHITELGGEYFRFDEMRQELRGERTGTRYAIGTRVRIQVSRVDLDGRKIDFRLVNEGLGLASRAPAVGDKPVGREPKARAPQAERFELDGGERTPSFKAEARKRGATKVGRAPKASERPATASKKAARKKR
jgi:ribonuclease R